MNELALFAGAGGGILAGRLLGWRTIAACEIEPYPRAVLLHNQKLGNLPHFPIWDDIRTLDGTPFRDHIDIVTGGFPCQDISAAGKGAGITGARSGLWTEMHRIIREVRPRYAFMENSPMLTARGLGRVLGDLAEAGYNAAWCVLGAADCGAPHRRDRIWILAETQDAIPDAACNGCEKQRWTRAAEAPQPAARSCSWWTVEPNLDRVAHGLAYRVDRLKALGNGQVPLVAATAFQLLKQRLNNKTRIN